MASLKKLERSLKRLYVIGDIHGCNEELSHLLDYLQHDVRITADDQLIFIGDYIDRGPNAWAVIDRLISLKQTYPETIFLKGNHEDMLLNYLGFPGRMGEAFLDNGGATTLFSYGIHEVFSPELVKEKFPAEHLKFLRELTDFVQWSDYIFVHAGLNKENALDEQTEEDLFWIRDDFIMYSHDFGKAVIFGHTPYHEVMLHLPYKIGIDTGLVYGNKLSCIELIEKRLFQIRRSTASVIEDDLTALFSLMKRPGVG